MCTQVYAWLQQRKSCALVSVSSGKSWPAFCLETDTPVAVTRHGDTVGYYIPARRNRSETERAALKQAAIRLQELLAAEGITEGEKV